MPEVVFPLDSTKKFPDQQLVGHNRWHPDIPPVATVRPGQSFRVHCREWFDGEIHNDDSATDVRDAPLSIVHALSGPFAMQGAEPGDLLVVDILDVGPIPQEDSGPLAGQGWGYTGIFARQNGGGLPHRLFPGRVQGGVGFPRADRDVPARPRGRLYRHGPSWADGHRAVGRAACEVERAGVRAARDRPRPRTAAASAAAGRDPRFADRSRVRPGGGGGGAYRPAPRERRQPGHQNLTKGSRVFYPVYVPGANLSVGDLHFSQGDGEITFCGAIEMGGFVDLHVDLIKGGMDSYGVSENAIFLPGNNNPQYCQWLAFSGISVTADGQQRYLDSQLAFQRACLHAIDYLTRFGYSPEQAYLILGAAPIEGRFSGVVDIPNACATVYLPTEIFDFDVRPSASGPTKIKPGKGAPTASF